MNTLARPAAAPTPTPLFSESITRKIQSIQIESENGKPGDFWNNKSDRLVARGKGKNAGIDVKHGSYDRYLARKKSGFLKKNLSF
mgnify:CR=1 FL=1